MTDAAGASLYGAANGGREMGYADQTRVGASRLGKCRNVQMPKEDLGREEKCLPMKMNKRPAIPADLKRKVLVEAGHRCAIPTCRYIIVEIHHIIPWNECKKHEYDNLIALCPNCHSLADRKKIDRKSLRMYKFNLRTVHDKFSQLEIDVLFEANRMEASQTIQWPPFMNILIKRICDAGLVRLSSRSGERFCWRNAD